MLPNRIMLLSLVSLCAGNSVIGGAMCDLEPEFQDQTFSFYVLCFQMIFFLNREKSMFTSKRVAFLSFYSDGGGRASVKVDLL